MKIDFVTPHSPHDIRSWSGLNFFIMKALQDQGAVVNSIFGLRAKPDFGLKWRWHWYNIQKKNYQYERTHCYTRQFGEQVNAAMDPKADILFSTSVSAIAYAKTSKPIFLYTDATFHNLAEYYGHFSRLSRSSREMGDDIERLALSKCTHIFYASDWAAQTAINYYGIPEKKISVLPFGANLLHPPLADDIYPNIEARAFEPLQLLLVGVDYYQKGVDRAIDITEKLNQLGIPAILTVAGLKHWPEMPLPDFVINKGFLNKDDALDASMLDALYRQAHFFILPTRIECFGVVFCEAAAYGLPVLATRKAGVPTAVQEGNTGILLDESGSTDAYADAIKQLVADRPKYNQMARNARSYFDTTLNWDAAGCRLFERFHMELEKKL